MPTRLPQLRVAVPAMLVLAACAARSAEPSAERKLTADEKNAPLTIADTLAWRNIESLTLSPDGRWIAYRFKPVEGDAKIILRSTTDDAERSYDIGEIPVPPPPTPGEVQPTASAGALLFSDDSQWLAFTTHPSRKEAAALHKQKKPVVAGARLVDVATGAVTDYPAVKRFAWSGDSARAIAFHRNPPGAAAEPPASSAGASPGSDKSKGSDLIVRVLRTGNELTIGSVSEFAFDKPGLWLAWTIDAQEKVGNGLNVLHLETGVVTPLVSGRFVFEKPSWNETGDGLTALRGTEDKGYENKLYSVIGVAMGAGRPTITIYDPKTDADFPRGMTVSGNRAVRWTDDRNGLLFGIVEAKKKTRPSGAGGSSTDTAAEESADAEPVAAAKSAAEKPETRAAAADDNEKPNLVLWHWQDPRLQSEQMVQEFSDKRFSYLATYRIAERKFIRLADEEMRDVTLPREGRWGLGGDRRAYELGTSLDGRPYRDLYAVDLYTGERKPVAQKIRWDYGISPKGDRLLYFANDHFHVYDCASGTTTNVTKSAPVSFLDVESDRDIVTPPVPPVGWAADNDHVLLTDRFDVWLVSARGTAALNLTGNGQKDQIRYRRLRVDSDENGIDLHEPVYFEMLGEWTKQTGLARKIPGRDKLEVIAWEPAGYGNLHQARYAETLVYSREKASAYPDFHVLEAPGSTPRQLTRGEEQLVGKATTAGTRLIDYVSAAPSGPTKGRKLQAALFLPANYEPGKRYPTIVYIYEQLSDGLNRFAHPDTRGFNRTLYTSNGYAVLMPDIVYNLDDPGLSAAWCVLPALRAAAATGIVDDTRVGLHGHSWGGYQTAFLITQTNAFKAAVAGAPLTNMVSMYSLLYKRTGRSNMSIFESSQGRFRTNYVESWEAYVRNSPVAHAKNVTTPLLLLHNDKDDAVDFTQGIEYYNTLRRLHKPVVMLEYVGEAHSLRLPANRLDYTIRMKEFFDHHLQDSPAPDWWRDGVKRLDMPDHLKSRQPSGPPSSAPKKSSPVAASSQ